jgi:hypothetical protein
MPTAAAAESGHRRRVHPGVMALACLVAFWQHVAKKIIEKHEDTSVDKRQWYTGPL